MTALLLALHAPVSIAAPAPSQEEVDAEARRIRDAMRALAQRNAWTGVDAKYEALVALGAELSLKDHQNGAEAALHVGDVLARRQRLEHAGKMGDEEVWPAIKEIDDHYGRVYLLGSEELTVAQMPFEPEPRNAITLAQDSVKSHHAFWGMLPTGQYSFGAQAITLESDVKPLLVSHAGLGRLRDPFDLIEETPGGLVLWNDIELAPVELAAVLRTRPSTRRVLERADRSFGLGLGLGIGGAATAILVAPLRPVGAITALVSIPFLVLGATGKKRAVARWKQDWAATTD